MPFASSLSPDNAFCQPTGDAYVIFTSRESHSSEVMLWLHDSKKSGIIVGAQKNKNAAHLGATSADSVARLLSQRCGRSAHLGAGHHMSTPSLLRPLRERMRACLARAGRLSRARCCDVDKYLRDGYLRDSLPGDRKKSQAIDVSRDAFAGTGT
ncbi:hypothetical protein MTO96_000731 [Rhipicephalus appendiculatus]